MVFGIFKKKSTKKANVIGRKIVKKKIVKKRPVMTRQKKKTKPAKELPMLEIIGKVIHYFPHVKAGVVKLKEPLAIGDNIHILGHTTNFKQTVTSMQINNVSIKEAKRGDEIGLLVKSRVRHGDTVYRL